MKLSIFIIFFVCWQWVWADTVPLEKVSLQLGWKYQFEYAGFIAAKEKGFYEQAGFDVELLELEQGTQVISNVLSEKSQFGIHTSTLAVEKLQGNPVVLMASYLKRSALVLLTKPDIYVPSDLKNKTIMAAKEQMNTGTLSWLFQRYGLSKNDITLVPHSYNTDDFVAGKVDAITAYLSNEPYYLKKNNIAFNVLDPSSYGIYSGGVNLFTSYSYAQNNVKKVKDFIAASNKGWQYALNNQSEIIDIILTKYSQRKSKEALRYEASIIEKLMLSQVEVIGSVDKRQIKRNLDRHPLFDEKKLKEFFFSDLFPELSLFTLEEQLYLNSKEQITLCVDPDWMPYEKIEKGEHVGISADYYKYFEQRIGVKFKLIETKNWAESLDKAKAGECELLSLLASTPEREKYWNFTQPYISTPLVLVTTIDKPFVNNIEAVLDKTMGVGDGYAYAEILRLRYPNIDLVDHKTLDQGLEQVVSGELYGYLDSLVTIGYRLQHNYVGQLKISGKFIDKFDLAIGVEEDDAILLNIMNKVVVSIDDSTHQQILNRWLSVNLEPKTDYALLQKVFFVFFILVVFGAFRFYVQKRYLDKLRHANEKIQKQNDLLQQLSTTDSLTKVANRLKLDAAIKEASSAFKRYGRPFSLILLDIDFFKKVNDVHGHIVGDNVLVSFCEQIQLILRGNDLLGRWGGEEFLIVCRETEEMDAAIVAEKICNAIRKHTFENGLKITVSSGVVEAHENWADSALLKHVDSALYYSKSTGRDRVTRYTDWLEKNIK